MYWNVLHNVHCCNVFCIIHCSVLQFSASQWTSVVCEGFVSILWDQLESSNELMPDTKHQTQDTRCKTPDTRHQKLLSIMWDHLEGSNEWFATQSAIMKTFIEVWGALQALTLSWWAFKASADFDFGLLQDDWYFVSLQVSASWYFVSLQVWLLLRGSWYSVAIKVSASWLFVAFQVWLLLRGSRYFETLQVSASW